MSTERQRLLTEFRTITGADEDNAKHFLDACKGNLETAIAMYLDEKTESSTSTGGSNSKNEEDNVRAPIPGTSGILIDDPHYVTTSRDRWSSRRRPRSVFDGFRDFKAETTQQEALLSSSSGRAHQRKRLEDLFRPPLELMHRGTLETARESGKASQKWLMVNVQNVREFSCQVLNRDVWSKASVQSLVRKNFIFWQVYNDSTEGDRFTTFYPVLKWPHVSILDPRTGERLLVWNEINTNNIEGKVEEFLADHGTIVEGDSDGPVPKKPKRDHSLIDDSEDTQLAAAIAASLAETQAKPKLLDDDEGYMISNDNSDVSGFDVSSDDENLIEDCDSRDGETERNDINAAENSSSIVDTKFDKNFFFEDETPEVPETSQENGQKGEVSDKKTYKKVNPRLKIGSLENGKDMSSLTTNIYNGETSRNSTPKEEVKAENLCRIMIRFPDGSREEIKMDVAMTLKDLSFELTRKGYPREDYDVVTHFPRKSIYSMGMLKTVKEAGLYPRAAVYLEEVES